MATDNKAVTCYLPKDVEDFVTQYCTQYGITRKDKEGNIQPSLGTGIIELLKNLSLNPDSVPSPISGKLPSNVSEEMIEKKILEVSSRLLEERLSSPIPSHLPDKVPDLESTIKDILPSLLLDTLPSMLLSTGLEKTIAELQERLTEMEKLLQLQESASITNHDNKPSHLLDTLPLPKSKGLEKTCRETISLEQETGYHAADTRSVGEIKQAAIEVAEKHGDVSDDANTQIKDKSSNPTNKTEEKANIPITEEMLAKGLSDAKLSKYLFEHGITKKEVHPTNLCRWRKKESVPTVYPNIFDEWEVRNNRWFPITNPESTTLNN